MTKLLTICGFVIIFFTFPVFSQNSNVWRGYVSYANGGIEPNEQVCDFVKDGQLRIAPPLSNQSIYWSNFLFNDTICISRDFSYEVRFKNSPDIGGVSDYESNIGFFSNGRKTSVNFAGLLTGLSKTSIQIADSIISKNQLSLVTDLSQWRIVKFNFINDTVSLSLDGTEIYRITYKHNICNLDIINLSLKGGGAVDWVKVYDNRNILVWQENFEKCTSFTPGIICDPFRLDQSITVSKPCVNDTLSLLANFPAMSYQWSNPLAQVDTNRVAHFPNPVNGIYDLKANINRCFSFSKNFNLTISPHVVVSKDINLCAGQTYTLPSGRIVSLANTYKDTLKTKLGCDSIITTKLSFNPIPTTPLSASVCNGQTYRLPSGKIVTTAGLYRDTTRNTEGCFQILEVNLSTTGGLNNNVSVKICEGQNYRLPKDKLVSAAGIYRDTFNLSGGCDSIIITNLTISSKPKLKIEIGKTGEILEGDMIPLSVNPVGSIYSWFENGKNIAQTQSSFILSVKGGANVYKVIVKTDVCESEDSIKILGLPKIELPNAFTPNGDNVNDYFTIVSKSSSEDIYKIESFIIFDRFGKQIYSNENGSKGWDGKRNGEEMMSDVYIYSIKVRSPGGTLFSFTGDVALIR